MVGCESFDLEQPLQDAEQPRESTNGGLLSQMINGAGIFTYIWVVFGVNVGKYTSPIEHPLMLRPLKRDV